MLEKGLIQVYTGNYDQFNFAPIGLALRAAGHHFRTHLTCFFPHEWMDGAHMASILFKPHLAIEMTHIENVPPDGKWNKAKIDEINQSFEGDR